MAKRDFFTRYLLIIRKVRRSRKSDFKEIAGYVFQQSELLDKPLELTIRTFQRDLNEIRSIFGIDIKCDRSTHQYYISDDFQEGYITRILESFDVFTSLTQVDNLSSQLIFEKRCTLGSEFIFDLLQAIKQKRVVTLVHQKYYDDESTIRDVEPYALKEFKHRWYLFARDLNDDTLKTFGLDRIQGINVSYTGFSGKDLPDPFLHFQNCYGIIRPMESEEEEVMFSTDPEQAKYLKSYPLHRSQAVQEENGDECIFKLKVFITYDFIRELMSMGDTIKVISPGSLRDALLAQARHMVKVYS
jgi:predicted DNA-binding transcriptional regulator YafY